MITHRPSQTPITPPRTTVLVSNCVAADATLHRARRATLAALQRDNAEYVVGVEGDGVAERVARAPR